MVDTFGAPLTEDSTFRRSRSGRHQGMERQAGPVSQRSGTVSVEHDFGFSHVIFIGESTSQGRKQGCVELSHRSLSEAIKKLFKSKVAPR